MICTAWGHHCGTNGEWFRQGCTGVMFEFGVGVNLLQSIFVQIVFFRQVWFTEDFTDNLRKSLLRFPNSPQMSIGIWFSDIDTHNLCWKQEEESNHRKYSHNFWRFVFVDLKSWMECTVFTMQTPKQGRWSWNSLFAWLGGPHSVGTRLKCPLVTLKTKQWGFDQWNFNQVNTTYALIKHMHYAGAIMQWKFRNFNQFNTLHKYLRIVGYDCPEDVLFLCFIDQDNTWYLPFFSFSISLFLCILVPWLKLSVKRNSMGVCLVDQNLIKLKGFPVF